MTTTQPPAIPTGINITAIRAVVARDLRAVRRSKAVVVPMLTVPVLLMVVLPLIVGYAARRASATGGRIDFLDSLPSQLADPIASLPQEEQLLTLVLGFLLEHAIEHRDLVAQEGLLFGRIGCALPLGLDPREQGTILRLFGIGVHRLLYEVLGLPQEREAEFHGWALPLLRFRDDLELQLDATAGVIHLRSCSRVGRSDLGTNRRRVEAIRGAFEDR